MNTIVKYSFRETADGDAGISVALYRDGMYTVTQYDYYLNNSHTQSFDNREGANAHVLRITPQYCFTSGWIVTDRREWDPDYAAELTREDSDWMDMNDDGTLPQEV